MGLRIISQCNEKYQNKDLSGALKVCIINKLSRDAIDYVDLSLNVLFFIRRMRRLAIYNRSSNGLLIGYSVLKSIEGSDSIEELVNFAVNFSINVEKSSYEIDRINYKVMVFMIVCLIANKKISFDLTSNVGDEYLNFTGKYFEISRMRNLTILEELNSIKELMALLAEIKFKVFQSGNLVEFKFGIFFDEEFYFKNYSDAKKSGLTPWDHYNKIGWMIGYNPSIYFSTVNYLEFNKDIQEGGINPLTHYIEHGLNEGRVSLVANGFKVDSNVLSLISKDFDPEYYLSQFEYSDFAKSNPLDHYLTVGWKEGYNPSKKFNTRYYLISNSDISDSGINPYLHYLISGIHEKREAERYYKLIDNFNPLVTVVIPNYNHEIYLEERVNSILNQSYKNIEIIFLDDCSSDGSLILAETLLEASNVPWRIVSNQFNSGSVSSQWQKGIELAKGDLIWICESDDFCDSNFLSVLTPHFRQKSVMMAVSKIIFCNAEGHTFDGMDEFRESAETGIWTSVVERTAFEWFNGAFGVRNIVSNVGGCVFRKVDLPKDVWSRAKEMKIVGDWFLYINILAGGKLVFDPNSVAYFRQHTKNTSASNFNKLYFYQECMYVLEVIRGSWGISDSVVRKFWTNICFEYEHYGMVDTHGDFANVFPLSRYLLLKKKRKHILIAFLGFNPGGGELLPINLANALIEHNYFVSMFALSIKDVNIDMVNRLKSRVPVFSVSDITDSGANTFVHKAGVDLVHSHMISCDVKLLLSVDPIVSIPYIVSLHGSYDDINVNPEYMPKSVLPFVSKWVYTADKNLKPFKELGISTSGMIKISNGMPVDDRLFECSRSDLGIPAAAVVFTLVARGIKQKGWRAAVNAFGSLCNENPDLCCYLLLVGDGYFTDSEKEAINGKISNIKFLGYQSCINGIYKISDCAIIPTRFDGESAPLCIIQALQEGLPVIATDIGEIRNMIKSPGGISGILLKNVRDTNFFIENLKIAMLDMCNDSTRKRFKDQSLKIKDKYSMSKMTDSYIDLYNSEFDINV